MTSEEHIYTTLISYLNELIDEFDFFIAYQGNDLPKKYGTIYNISSVDKKKYKKYFDRANPKEKLQTHRVFLIQVDLYSDVDDLVNVAEKIKVNLKSDNSCFYFAKENLNITKSSLIRSIPEVVQGEYMFRRSFDITVEFIDTYIFDVDYILREDIEHR